MKLKDALAGKLSADELAKMGRSFDVIGDIAILELQKGLGRKAATIGKALLLTNKNIKTVALELGEHTGKYRTQKLRILAGEKRFLTLHKESGVTVKIDVNNCYFSPRLGSERLRIARLVKPDERVLVAGSGVGIYPLIIAKHSEAKEIVGIEWNPLAHKLSQENIVLNKLTARVKAIKGDARKAQGRFDRMIIAIPHEGVNFVPALLKNLKSNGTLHVLDFAEETDLEAPARKLEELCKDAKRKITILSVTKAGQPGVRRYRVCVDARIH